MNNTKSIGSVRPIPLSKLEIHPTHVRKNPGNLDSLGQSIGKNTILEPIIVTRKKNTDRYYIISGVRRYLASVALGAQDVICYVKEEIDESEISIQSFITNNEHKDIDPIEIANFFADQKKLGLSHRELEVLSDCSPAKITLYLKLLDLPESVQTLISSGKLTPSHGVELSKLSSPKHQEKMAKHSIDFEWSAKRTGLKVEKFLKKNKQPILKSTKIPEGDIPGVFLKDSRDMSEIESGAVHLIVTSPSYYIGMEFEKGYSEEEHWENIRAVIEEMVRVTCPGGYIIINVGDMHNYKGPKGNNGFSQIKLVGHIYQKFLRKYGIYLKDIIIWCKATHAFSRDVSKAWSENTPHTGYGIHINHDYIYVFQKKGERELPSEDIILRSRITKEEWVQWATSVWMIDRVRRMEGHPAMFPEELVRRLVRMYSYEGDVVLDPFLGSGTTVKVARELGRQAYGYERLEQYKEVIMKKLGIEPAPETYSMVDYGKQSLALNKPVATDSFLEPSAESKSCKPRFICSEGFDDGLLTGI